MNTNFYPQNLSYHGSIIYDPVIIFSHGMMDNFHQGNEKKLPVSNDKPKKTITIILADDDEDDRDLFKEALQITAPAAHLLLAEDGRMLLSMLEKSKEIPDVIFLDLNMPYKSGIECLAEIRNHEQFKNIPVVIYSTSSSLKDINDTFDKGANLYVKKPNSFNELRLITSKVLALNWDKYKPHYSRTHFLFSSKTE